MRVFLLIAVLALASNMNFAFAADEFGSSFVNETPSALSDRPYVEIQNPWDIQPAAGEEEPTEETLDVPMSKEDATKQLKALQNEHPNLLVEDVSP